MVDGATDETCDMVVYGTTDERRVWTTFGESTAGHLRVIESGSLRVGVRATCMESNGVSEGQGLGRLQMIDARSLMCWDVGVRNPQASVSTSRNVICTAVNCCQFHVNCCVVSCMSIAEQSIAANC